MARDDREVSLNLVVVTTADLARTVEFYTALGISFMPERHGKGPEHVAAAIVGTVFEIYPRDALPVIQAPVRPGFRVVSVDETVAKLRKLGAAVLSRPQDFPWGRMAVLNDPDGHRLEISEPHA
jgi:predicted enzyme related to lactoylglutathione lyase